VRVDKTHQLQHEPIQSHRVNTTRQQTVQTRTHALYKTTLHYRQVLTTPRITHRGLPTHRIHLQPLRLTQQILRNIVCVPPIHHQRTPTRNVQRHPIQPCQVVPTARRQPKLHDKAPRSHQQVNLHPVKIVPMRRPVSPKRLLRRKPTTIGTDILTHRHRKSIQRIGGTRSPDAATSRETGAQGRVAWASDGAACG
jgi:hypothetical protein